MRKISLLVAVAFGVCAFAPAQAKKDPHSKVKPAVMKTIKCPVMPQVDVNIADATKKKMYADYKGRRYYFCCPGCPGAFKASPAKYARSASIPTPKPVKVTKPVKKKS